MLGGQKAPDVGTDLSSRSVSRQVFSALVSLTSVFGMGTGGPSPLKAPTIILFRPAPASAGAKAGDPWESRTPVWGVRGPRLDHLTNGPFGTPSGTRTLDTLIKSQVLYQLS